MINTNYFWTIVIFLALGTFIIRGSFIFLSSKINIPARVLEVFAFIPAAVLPALIAPLVFFHHGEIEPLYGKERLIILLLATGVCYLTKSMLATIIFGLVTLFVFTNSF